MYAIKCESCRKIIEFSDEKIPKDKRFAWAFCPHCGNATCIINKGEALYENDELATEVTKVDVKPKRRGRKPKEKKC